MPGESKTAVIGAVAANFVIAVAKFLAAAVGGSSALLAEGLHSLVDGANDSLLLFGLKRSKRPPDTQHPFGHGKELYFWSLLVSVIILSIGGGATAWEGIIRVLHPERIEKPLWSYLALAAGFLFDGLSLLYSVRQFRKQNPGKGFWEAVRESKDPSTFIVIGEDSAALLGVLFAAAGVTLNTAGLLRADGIASILIGLTLGSAAVFLIAQTRDLIIGEAVEDEIAHSIHQIASDDSAISAAGNPRTLHFGRETVLVTMDLCFDRNGRAGEVIDAVDRIQTAIRDKFPAVKYVYIDPESKEP